MTIRDPRRYDQVPDGCWVACIAGLTGLSHDELVALIPRLPDGAVDGSMGTEYHNAVNAYTRSRGWRLSHLGPDRPKGFALGAGTSPRGHAHAVIVLDGNLWYDPHPSRAGVLALENFEILTEIHPAGICSRCLEAIKDFRAPDGGMTAGYYLADAWRKYVNVGEVYVCDRCMWNDPAFIVDYGRVPA